MSKKHRHELGVGALVLAALGLLAWMALQVGALRGLGAQVHLVSRLPDAAGLADGAVVKVAGVDVGRVTRLGIEHDEAVLHLEVRQEVGIRQDARLQVRARSMLGEKYVELVPQSTDAPLAQDGDVLVAAPTPYEIDQLVNRLGPLVDAVDPERLNQSIAIVNEALARDPQRVDRMLTDLETLLHNAAAASEELPALVEEGRGTLHTVRQVAQEARPVLARADRVVTQVEAGTTDLQATRAEVDGLIADTRQVVTEGGGMLGRLEGSLDEVEVVLSNLAEIDKWELRRLLREEGILVRLRRHDVDEGAAEGADLQSEKPAP